MSTENSLEGIRSLTIQEIEEQSDPLYLPSEIQPPLGIVYSWIRYSAGGEIDYVNLKRMADMGFRPVPFDRHPNVKNDGKVPFMVSRAGSVLMERTEKSAKIYQERVDFVAGIVAHPSLFSKVPPSKVLAAQEQLHNVIDPLKEAIEIGRIISGPDREQYVKNLSTIKKEVNLIERE